MTIEKAARFESISFFLAWTLLAVIGSGFNLNKDFWLLEAFIAVYHIAQYFYLGKLLADFGKKKTFLMNVLFYLVVGIILACLTLLIVRNAPSQLIVGWVVIVVATAEVYGLMIWAINKMIDANMKKKH
ncbi:MAG: hypothetical protein UHN88_06135 [Eubacterium sp.]|nr:hypothetical protein [Eubacterium sp.]